MEIVIVPDENAVAQLAADVFERHIREGNATLGLATGSSPMLMYKELIRRHREEGLSFADAKAFLLDEYVGLPREHEQSYYSFIREHFTSHIDIRDEEVYSPDAFRPDVAQAALDYDQAIWDSGSIDVQLLGIGADGHIGFNEPGSSLVSRTRLKTLYPQTIKDNARFFDSPEEVPYHAVTQGLGTILEARHLLLIATGEAKSQAVAAMVEGPLGAMCPASVLQMHQVATVIVDEAAASKLRFTEYYRYAFDHKPEWQVL